MRDLFAVKRLFDAAVARPDHIGGHGADKGIERFGADRVHHPLADNLRIEPRGGEALGQHRFIGRSVLRISSIANSVRRMPRIIGASRRPLNEIINSDPVENEKVMRFFQGQAHIVRIAPQPTSQPR
jgi:hypothetical protein